MEGSFIHEWVYEGRVITFSWLGDVPIEALDVAPTRVYAIALTADDELLLVGDGRGEFAYWLPGGGIEAGETPDVALHRELMEEAAATIHARQRLGVQRIHDPLTGVQYNLFYWCRITLAPEFLPETEVTERLLVTPDAFLDRLSWGRDDPKAVMLLNRGLALNQAYTER